MFLLDFESVKAASSTYEPDPVLLGTQFGDDISKDPSFDAYKAVFSPGLYKIALFINLLVLLGLVFIQVQEGNISVSLLANETQPRPSCKDSCHKNSEWDRICTSDDCKGCRPCVAMLSKSDMDSLFDDFTLLGVGCGRFKCFFLSKSNKAIGYLTAQEKTAYKNMQEAWEVGERIRRDFGTPHFMLEPPRVSYISNVTSKRLSSGKYHNSIYEDQVKEWFWKPTKTITQKCRRFAKDILIIFCRGPKWEQMKHERKDFINQIEDSKLFLHQMKQSFDGLMNSFEEESNRCLLWDFQAVLTRSGEIYNMDLDRCGLSASRKVSFSAEQRHLCLRHINGTRFWFEDKLREKI